jgi:hypothetical protein
VNVHIFFPPPKKKITHFFTRWKPETWQTYRGTSQTNGKNLKPGTFCAGGPKWEMENAMFFNILAPMGKTRNIV